MTDPASQPYPYAPPVSREIVELARRPGMMLMSIVLWPSAIVAALAAWALHLLHGHITALVGMCGGAGG